VIFGEEKGPQAISVVSKDFAFLGGTGGSNPLRSTRESVFGRSLSTARCRPDVAEEYAFLPQSRDFTLGLG